MTGLTESDLRFNIAKLVPGSNGDPAVWQNYINRASGGATQGSQERVATGYAFGTLARQLNVLQPVSKAVWRFDSRTSFSQLRFTDFRADSRLKKLRDEEVFDHVVLSFAAKTGTRVTIAKDFPPEIEKLEARLRQCGAHYDSEVIRDQENGRFVEKRFDLLADFQSSVRVLPGVADGVLDRSGEAHFPPRPRGCIGQLGEGAVGERHHLGDLALGLRVGVVDRNVDAVLHEAGRPAAADDATADDGGLADVHLSPAWSA